MNAQQKCITFFVTTIFSKCEMLSKTFKFTTDNDGFYLLFSYLAPLAQNNIIICLESTAHYCANKAKCCFNHNLYIPFQVNHLHGQTEPVPLRMSQCYLMLIIR